MKINPIFRVLFLLSVMFVTFISCDTKPQKPKEIPLSIIEDSVYGVENAATVRENTAAIVAEGLELTLWASDSLAPDPIAMSVDDEGAIYLTRTNRQKNSEFDIRGYRDWMTPSISFQTVEDRRNFLHETFAPEKSDENSWLKDLNNDTIHDWRDLAVEKEEIWKLEDRNGNGIADVSTRILEDFNEEITDVAGAMLVRENDVFVGVGPDMWRLTDTNDDQILDEKTSIAHGFAIHIGFGGHGMSGAIEGPDGKIYWGIGDIGMNLTTSEGVHHKYPNQGVIVRSNPDGSDFEVFAAGLRNTHEFVFDEYGNIISADNDGDHRGESERLVYIVEGHDAGWRANWQYGKYTDPKNNGYNVWMDEKMYMPRWDGQAAYFLPPIQNFHNGPTGMVYNPGTALGKDWQNKFFLTEFVGNPGRSHIWAFDLEPKGASFVLKSEQDIVSGILPTGIRFGPDGALYVADWINGWNTKDYGRVWKMDVSSDKNDLKSERERTQQLMTTDYKELSVDELSDLLKYADMRIRQKAQFELVTRGSKGEDALQESITQNENQLARVHGIWGLGQLASKDIDASEPLLELLNDSDHEIVAQAVKILGDVKNAKAGELLIPLLKHESERVRFFTAQALGRIKQVDAVQPLLDMLAANADVDNYVRHAAVLALSRIGDEAAITALVGNENRSLRIAAVLVLRRMQSAKVAEFLNDADEYIVAEAARAINDDWSIEVAMPALAETLNKVDFTSEPLFRRAINAALRVGRESDLDNLIAFTQRENVSSVLRAEALAAISNWTAPSVLDRVDGRRRADISRDAAIVQQKVKAVIPDFLKSKDPEILASTAKILGAIQLNSFNSELKRMMQTNKTPQVRVAAMQALGSLKYEDIKGVMALGMKDKSTEVRALAIDMLKTIDIPANDLPGIVKPIFKNGSPREQQSMLGVLAEMPIVKSEPVLSSMIDQAANKSISPNVILDLMEAVEASNSETLIAKLDVLKNAGYGVDAFNETLYGGNRGDGRRYFINNSTGQCVRCHFYDGQGGEVGPPLDGIADKLSREQLLEALINPTARISPGYGNVTLTLKDGQVVTGLLEEETHDELILRTSDAEPLEVAISRIVKRENMTSSMPPMGRIMSKRELRDLIEFLASLKSRPTS
ncbi:HEAT repeat domain-containing protein [Aurantibacter crassamenti]|uniref:HEAT repeat domain-containing protein n=1 Tax=Aurantibacter crassamenti TaxID=1837375 RepID=UPI001939366A|nr:HEAT repeat domain-containing protein [Aurantibacter crassamenti]MBM1104827.1 HEAT repeat domain-containing protein [Aurantibacter crassamenti]